MKRILLTSTALVAFAGAAAAEVSFTGTFKAGYNDTFKSGAYWDAGLAVKGSQELNGGLTAGFSANINIGSGASAFTLNNQKVSALGVAGAAGTTVGTFVTVSDYEFYLKSDNYGMYVGDTKTATEAKWSAGVDGLSENDFAKKGENGELAVLRGEGKVAGFDFALSTNINTSAKFDAYQFAAKYSTGAYNFGIAYQDKDSFGGARVGVKAGGSFAGADVTVAYVRTDATGASSTGIAVSYPVGPVKASAYYASNSADVNKFGVAAAYEEGAVKVTAKYDATEVKGSGVFTLDGSYDLGNGLVLKAGGSSDDKAYVGAEYDLGGGASLLASYGYDKAAGATKKIGEPDYMEGVTTQVSFKF